MFRLTTAALLPKGIATPTPVRLGVGPFHVYLKLMAGQLNEGAYKHSAVKRAHALGDKFWSLPPEGRAMLAAQGVSVQHKKKYRMKKKRTPRPPVAPTKYALFVKSEYKKLPKKLQRNAPKALKMIAAKWQKLQEKSSQQTKETATPMKLKAAAGEQQKLSEPVTLEDLERMADLAEKDASSAQAEGGDVEPMAAAGAEEAGAEADGGEEESSLANLMSEYKAEEVEGLVKMAEGLAKTQQGKIVLAQMDKGKSLQEALDVALAAIKDEASTKIDKKIDE